MNRYINADDMIEDSENMKTVADSISIDGIIKYLNEHAFFGVCKAWISAKEEVPEDTRDVLVFCRSKKGYGNVDKGYFDGNRWIHRGTAEVTHWMDIPDLPEDEKK